LPFLRRLRLRGVETKNLSLNRFVPIVELVAFAEQAEVWDSRNKVPGLIEYDRTHRDQNVGIRKGALNKELTNDNKKCWILH